jgi:hypothetical protein
LLFQHNTTVQSLNCFLLLSSLPLHSINFPSFLNPLNYQFSYCSQLITDFLPDCTVNSQFTVLAVSFLLLHTHLHASHDTFYLVSYVCYILRILSCLLKCLWPLAFCNNLGGDSNTFRSNERLTKRNTGGGMDWQV